AMSSTTIIRQALPSVAPIGRRAGDDISDYQCESAAAATHINVSPLQQHQSTPTLPRRVPTNPGPDCAWTSAGTRVRGGPGQVRAVSVDDGPLCLRTVRRYRTVRRLRIVRGLWAHSRSQAVNGLGPHRARQG